MEEYYKVKIFKVHDCSGCSLEDEELFSMHVIKTKSLIRNIIEITQKSAVAEL